MQEELRQLGEVRLTWWWMRFSNGFVEVIRNTRIDSLEGILRLVMNVMLLYLIRSCCRAGYQRLMSDLANFLSINTEEAWQHFGSYDKAARRLERGFLNRDALGGMFQIHGSKY